MLVYQLASAGLALVAALPVEIVWQEEADQELVK